MIYFLVSGIGFECALEFAKRGARVILACRNTQEASKAREKIIQLTCNHNISTGILDFSSLISVRNFAENILRTEERLDILVNNAGAGIRTDEISEDGFSLQMQINYYAHVLITLLLSGKKYLFSFTLHWDTEISINLFRFQKNYFSSCEE